MEQTQIKTVELVRQIRDRHYDSTLAILEGRNQSSALGQERTGSRREPRRQPRVCEPVRFPGAREGLM